MAAGKKRRREAVLFSLFRVCSSLGWAPRLDHPGRSGREGDLASTGLPRRGRAKCIAVPPRPRQRQLQHFVSAGPGACAGLSLAGQGAEEAAWSFSSQEAQSAAARRGHGGPLMGLGLGAWSRRGATATMLPGKADRLPLSLHRPGMEPRQLL